MPYSGALLRQTTMIPFETRQAISRFLFVSDPPAPADLVFVAASPSLSSIKPAISLYKSGLAPLILISGAGRMPDGRPEWEAYTAYAEDNGVPASALLTERVARNTLENFRFGAAMIAARPGGWSGITTVALCAKPFHMRRVVMTARQQLPQGLNLLACPPADSTDLTRDNWWMTERGRKRVLSELARIGEYALNGDICDV